MQSTNNKELQMRVITQQEIFNVSGGEATCTVGIPSGVSCTGTVGELRDLAVKAYAFLAVSPFTVPGIIHRLSRQ